MISAAIEATKNVIQSRQAANDVGLLVLGVACGFATIRIWRFLITHPHCLQPVVEVLVKKVLSWGLHPVMTVSILWGFFCSSLVIGELVGLLVVSSLLYPVMALTSFYSAFTVAFNTAKIRNMIRPITEDPLVMACVCPDVQRTVERLHGLRRDSSDDLQSKVIQSMYLLVTYEMKRRSIVPLHLYYLWYCPPSIEGAHFWIKRAELCGVQEDSIRSLKKAAEMFQEMQMPKHAGLIWKKLFLEIHNGALKITFFEQGMRCGPHFDINFVAAAEYFQIVAFQDSRIIRAAARAWARAAEAPNLSDEQRAEYLVSAATQFTLPEAKIDLTQSVKDAETAVCNAEKAFATAQGDAKQSHVFDIDKRNAADRLAAAETAVENARKAHTLAKEALAPLFREMDQTMHLASIALEKAGKQVDAAKWFQMHATFLSQQENPDALLIFNTLLSAVRLSPNPQNISAANMWHDIVFLSISDDPGAVTRQDLSASRAASGLIPLPDLDEAVELAQ